MIPELETERMWLRPVRLEDAEQTQKLFPPWEIVRHLGAVVPWPYLRFTEGGKRRFGWIGDDATEAIMATRKMEATLRAKALGLAVKSPLPETPTYLSVDTKALDGDQSMTLEHSALESPLSPKILLPFFGILRCDWRRKWGRVY
jgi:hypothetical protein